MPLNKYRKLITMRKHTALTLIFCAALVATGCQPTSVLETDSSVDTSEQRLDFEALLASVDDVIGMRFQSMQIGGIESATYKYGGPIETVLDIVEPVAKKHGFSKKTDELKNAMGTAELEMQERMGIEMNNLDHRLFAHSNGDTLVVSRMDMSNDNMDMKMLTIQLMNPKDMADFDAVIENP